MNIGFPLGLLIGVLTGVYTFLLLTNLLPEQILAKVGLVGLPAFWFGGPWLLGPVLKSIDWDHVQNAYVITLAFTWVPFALLGTAWRAIRLGNLFGGGPRG